MAFRYKQKPRKRGRIPKTVSIAKTPMTEGLTPLSKSARALYVGSARVIYILGVSRGTVWRLLQAARKKAAQCISEGRPLLILNGRNTRTSEESSTPFSPNREH
jgi:hypothetical protein